MFLKIPSLRVRQTDIETYREADRQAGSQIAGNTDRQRGRQTENLEMLNKTLGRCDMGVSIITVSFYCTLLVYYSVCSLWCVLNPR